MVRVPNQIAGANLDSGQRRRLVKLLGIIQGANPRRDPSQNLSQAIKGFKMTAKKVGPRWVDKPYFRLDNGQGALVIPNWLDDLDMESQ